nr:hypothetical protein [Thiocapsa sp. KS1]
MHLYQRRPRAQRAPAQHTCSRGKCCLAPQSLLFFGDDRHAPVSWRHVIVWAETGNLVQVLPATTKKNSELFFISRDECLRDRPREEERDSYVCPHVEVVPRTELREVGVLKGGMWLAVIQWKREREGRR